LRNKPSGAAIPSVASRGRPVARRALLGGAALAVALAAGRAVAAETPEVEKIKQADAHYRNQPNGQQRCEICLQFLPPGHCRIVQGPIEPHGWCQFFAARDNAH
jgi:hypothetical protein